MCVYNCSLFISDTICFSKDAHRYNEIDVQIAQKFESILKINSRQDIYYQLIDAKNSVTSFSFKEMIFKDMKILEPFDNLKVITSSISGKLAKDLIFSEQREQVLNDLKEISNEQNFSLILIMGITSHNLDKIERDIAIFSLNDNLLKKVNLSNNKIILNRI